jgi:nicotinamide-nucleotide amidase
VKKTLDQIKKYMLQHQETLAVAESVTSGTLQAAFSRAEDATLFFQGGLTAYNVGQKSLQLNIDPIYGLSCNCVSERIASEMAQHICKRFCCDWGIGITGYATPVPELKIKTPFSYYAFYNKDRGSFTRMISSKKMTIDKVQQYFVAALLKDFSGYLSGNKK